MEPKRLIGLELYEEYSNFAYGDQCIGFGDTTDRCIRKAFLKAQSLLNDSKKISNSESKLGFDVMQLGWGTVAKFNVTEAGFQLSYIKACNESKNPSSVTVNEVFGQVVTRAVDTCTFVCLQSGDTVVLAHLDSDDHAEGLNAIKTLMPNSANVTGFCSFVENDPEKPVKRQFCDALQSLYGGRIRFCDRVLNDYAYYGHFEIGIYLNDYKAVELFGDMTFMPFSGQKTTPCFLFKSISEISLDEKGKPNYPVKTGLDTDDGHRCVII